jgi:ATP/maltotriose-dependent transcriptional regulator MalT
MYGVRTQPPADAPRNTPATDSRAAIRLGEAARRPIAVVVAPAGFGKSALLRAFAAERDGALLIDLGPDAATFRDAVRALCEALRDVVPGPTRAPPSTATASSRWRTGSAATSTGAASRW